MLVGRRIKEEKEPFILGYPPFQESLIFPIKAARPWGILGPSEMTSLRYVALHLRRDGYQHFCRSNSGRPDVLGQQGKDPLKSRYLSICLFIYSFIKIYIYTYTYRCIYIYVYIYICIYIYIFIFIYIHTYLPYIYININICHEQLLSIS